MPITSVVSWLRLAFRLFRACFIRFLSALKFSHWSPDTGEEVSTRAKAARYDRKVAISAAQAKKEMAFVLIAERIE